jgi:hypothetical protein
MRRAEIIEKTSAEFLIRHGCEVAGHYYECIEDCICICGLPISGNDHSDCPVELRPCPEHKAEQERRMAEAMGCEEQTEIEPFCEERDAAPRHCQCGCSDIVFGKIVGWCLHCDHVYAHYTPEIENRHFAYDCPDVPATVKEAARSRLAKSRV